VESVCQLGPGIQDTLLWAGDMRSFQFELVLLVVAPLLAGCKEPALESAVGRVVAFGRLRRWYIVGSTLQRRRG
jgi:hypothetical protein